MIILNLNPAFFTEFEFRLLSDVSGNLPSNLILSSARTFLWRQPWISPARRMPPSTMNTEVSVELHNLFFASIYCYCTRLLRRSRRPSTVEVFNLLMVYMRITYNVWEIVLSNFAIRLVFELPVTWLLKLRCTQLLSIAGDAMMHSWKHYGIRKLVAIVLSSNICFYLNSKLPTFHTFLTNQMNQ